MCCCSCSLSHLPAWQPTSQREDLLVFHYRENSPCSRLCTPLDINADVWLEFRKNVWWIQIWICEAEVLRRRRSSTWRTILFDPRWMQNVQNLVYRSQKILFGQMHEYVPCFDKVIWSHKAAVFVKKPTNNGFLSQINIFKFFRSDAIKI